MSQGAGYSDLWGWFGLTRAAFAVLPRVLMHEMPDDWQAKMVALLHEFDDAFPRAGIDTRVLKVEQGRIVKWPRWFLNYRYPEMNEIEKLR